MKSRSCGGYINGVNARTGASHRNIARSLVTIVYLEL